MQHARLSDFLSLSISSQAIVFSSERMTLIPPCVILQVQDLTDDFIDKVNKATDAKEAELAAIV